MNLDQQTGLKSMKEYRLNPNHEGCKCNEYILLCNKTKSKWVANQIESSIVDSIKHPLHTIHENEGEKEFEREEEYGEYMYGPVISLITYVDTGSDFFRDTDRELSGTDDGKGENEKGKGPYIGLLSGMGEGGIIGGYLDSGANAHIFNTQNVFQKIDTKNTNIFTACEDKNKNTASVEN